MLLVCMLTQLTQSTHSRCSKPTKMKEQFHHLSALQQNPLGTSLASIALNKLSKWLILASCKAYLEASKGVLLFLQTSPGSFNNDALEAMDYVMETARKLGMKVMLSFADNWKFQGTILLTICILPPGHSGQFLMTHFNMIGIFPIWTKSC